MEGEEGIEEEEKTALNHIAMRWFIYIFIIRWIKKEDNYSVQIFHSKGKLCTMYISFLRDGDTASHTKVHLEEEEEEEEKYDEYEEEEGGKRLCDNLYHFFLSTVILCYFHTVSKTKSKLQFISL